MEQLDFVYVIGDAYVDHPVLWARDHQPASGSPDGYTGGDHLPAGLEKREQYQVFGEPRLGFLVISRKYGFHGESLFGIQKKTGRPMPTRPAV